MEGKSKFRSLKGRYSETGILIFVAALTIFQCVLYSAEILKELQSSIVNYSSVGVLVCNIVCLFFICVQMFRIDSRNLLTDKTAGIITNCGMIIILCMLVRGRLFKHIDDGNMLQTYIMHQDWLSIYVIGFLLIFLGKIIRKAVKIKEENDFTI